MGGGAIPSSCAPAGEKMRTKTGSQKSVTTTFCCWYVCSEMLDKEDHLKKVRILYVFMTGQRLFSTCATPPPASEPRLRHCICKISISFFITLYQMTLLTLLFSVVLTKETAIKDSVWKLYRHGIGLSISEGLCFDDSDRFSKGAWPNNNNHTLSTELFF